MEARMCFEFKHGLTNISILSPTGGALIEHL